MKLLGLPFLFVLVINVAVRCYESYPYGPTTKEINKALQFQQTTPAWGFQARKERDLRILVIGGSNSLGFGYGDYMVDLFKNSSWHPSFTASVVLNGISGCSPYHFIGMRYDFQDSPPRSWPNVFIMDFAVNYGSDGNAAHELDSVIQTIRFRYRRQKLPDPDFVFLEFFSMYNHARNMHSGNFNKRLSSLSFSGARPIRDNGDFRGCTACKEFREVTSFYGFPTISWREMMFPAFVRYFLNTNSTFTANKWQYTMDAKHLSPMGGQFLVDTLIVPFFTAAMAPRAVELPEEERSVYGMGVEVRMFPPTRRPFRILTMSAVSYNFETSSNALYRAIRKPVQYENIKPRVVDGRKVGNECYGTTDKQARLNVDFKVPAECNKFENCKVSMEWIHSWNTSYGFVNCDLLRSDNVGDAPKKLDTRFVNVTRDGDGTPIKHTGPIRTTFEPTVKEGSYTVSCHKLDDRLTCMWGVSVSASIVL